MFYRMLGKYQEQSKFEDNMMELGKGLETRDTNRMKDGAHKIKGSCGYIGASRLHYATFYIHDKWEQDNNDYEGMV